MGDKVFVIGAGGWGTALSLVLRANGKKVSLWEFDPAYAARLKAERTNSKFLPGVDLPAGLEVVTTFEALKAASVAVLATPTMHARRVLEAAKPFFPKGCLLINVAKGIEQASLLTMSQVVAGSLKGLDYSFATLSGPSHGEEVARQVPTTVVAASKDKGAAERAQKLFNNPFFRVYTSSDLMGVELGGSVKNVIALAAGIADGLGVGDNTKAALMTRGLAEMTRLGTALGAKAATFAGLAGMGDLVVTCMSRHSRNRGVGEQLGKGRRLKDILAGMDMVAEGVGTAVSAKGLAEKAGVEMPICFEVNKVLFEDKPAKQALTDLMTRAPKSEEV
jgi:glycerol-3-phosphate dehydrogenase (NAD(P)+)